MPQEGKTVSVINTTSEFYFFATQEFEITAQERTDLEPNHTGPDMRLNSKKILCIQTGDRIEILMKVLAVDETWKNEEKETTTKIRVEFNDIFLLKGDKLTHINQVIHHIRTQLGHPLINQKMYRLPEKHKAII